MAGGSHLLTDTKIKNAKKRGRLRDGLGLWMNVTNSGSKSWVYRWTIQGKAREIGLGSYPAVSLAFARDEASKCRTMVAEGLDPKFERNKEAEPTFKECVELYLAEHEGEWRNEKHRHQWRQTLGPDYCSAILGMRISDIAVNDVLGVLREPWKEKPETASRLRGRIERILGFAKVRGWREGDNPAVWRGNLSEALPKPRKLTRGHFKAMPYKEVPGFLARLKELESSSARAMEFLLFTVCRSGEILNAKWDEIDLEESLWTIPSDRTKTGEEYIIPLTAPAKAILQPLYQLRISEYVFPGQRRGKGIHPDKPLSPMALEMLLRRMKVSNATPHGFRSSFRDWVGDETSFPREVAEQCLAHSIGNATERAYRRGSAIEKRRQLLNAWADYCQGYEPENVMQLHG